MTAAGDLGRDDVAAAARALLDAVPPDGVALRRVFEVAGRTVTVCVRESAMGAQLPDAFSHLRDGDLAGEGLTVEVRGGVDVWSGLEPGHYRCGALHVGAFPPDRVELVDLEHDRALILLDDRRPPPAHVRHRPAAHILSTWLPTRGVAFLHAAAVAPVAPVVPGDGDGAVLLVGPGGSGKSTTAVAAMQRGFRLLGDDACAVHVPTEGGAAATGRPSGAEASLRVHSLYRTAKLRADGAERIAPADGETVDDETFLVLAPEAMCLEARVDAVVFVRPDPTGREPRLARVPARSAMGPLLSTGLKAVTGGEAATRVWLRLVHALDRIPAYSLDLVWDLEAVVDLLGTIARAPVEVR